MARCNVTQHKCERDVFALFSLNARARSCLGPDLSMDKWQRSVVATV